MEQLYPLLSSEVQYIKKKQNETKQNKHTKQESKQTEYVFFLVLKIGNHFSGS